MTYGYHVTNHWTLGRYKQIKEGEFNIHYNPDGEKPIIIFGQVGEKHIHLDITEAEFEKFNGDNKFDIYRLLKERGLQKKYNLPV